MSQLKADFALASLLVAAWASLRHLHDREGARQNTFGEKCK